MNKMMKVLLAAGLVIGSISTAFADSYVGVEYGYANAEDERESQGVTVDQDNDYNDFTLKYGIEAQTNWNVEVTLSRTKFDEATFDASNDEMYELGADIIYDFADHGKLTPFVKAGLGYGWMDVDGYTESTINSVSLNAGVGVKYQLVEDLYVVTGVDAVYRQWQDIDVLLQGATIETSNTAAKAYVGLDYHF